MNQREAFTYLRETMLMLDATGFPNEELGSEWGRAFEALDVLEPEEGRRLRPLREAAEQVIAHLEAIKPEVYALGPTEEISPGLLTQAVHAARELRKIDQEAADLMDWHPTDLAGSAEVLAFRYELRVAAGWLHLAQLPGLAVIQPNRPCPNCEGRGYIKTEALDALCTHCKGSGMVES